jgi:protein kinase A
MELYQGGELGSVLQTGSRMGVPEQVAIFYAANMLQGMSYMHDRHVIHRDLKPENVLLDSRGYTVLVDLGFARVVMDKTHTFCGTPAYIAPEVILQKGKPICGTLMYRISFLASLICSFLMRDRLRQKR